MDISTRIDIAPCGGHIFVHVFKVSGNGYFFDRVEQLSISHEET